MSKIISIIVIIIVIAGGAWTLTSNKDSSVIPVPVAENIKTESSPSMDTTSPGAPQSNTATPSAPPATANAQIEILQKTTATTDAPATQPSIVNTETGPPQPTPVVSPEAQIVNVKEFTVDGKNFSFTPSTLTVKKGNTVRIIFKNVGGFHDFKVDELNAATKQIGDGQTDTIEFVADKAGSFEYYCSIGSHRAMGMKGTLIVQ